MDMMPEAKPANMNGQSGELSTASSAPQNDLLGMIGDETPISSPSSATAAVTSPLDDLLGFGSTDAPASPQSSHPSFPTMQVNPAFRIDPPTFQVGLYPFLCPNCVPPSSKHVPPLVYTQKNWSFFTKSTQEQQSLSPTADLSSPAPLIAHLAPGAGDGGAFGLQCMASGGQAGALKLYMYTQDATTGAVYLVEILTSQGAGGGSLANLTIKCEEASDPSILISSVKQRLSSY